MRSFCARSAYPVTRSTNASGSGRGLPRRMTAAIVAGVDRDPIGIRFGDFHSRRLVERLGLMEGNGVVRASMVHYNTLVEVDRLVESLQRALA